MHPLSFRLVIASALATSACGGTPGSTCGPARATVARVVDGDTIDLTTGEKVRYILVDAPETTSGKSDCFGKEAAEYNRQLVEGKEVDLAYDAAGCTDRYGRLLAYVSVGGAEVNTRLVERGYACLYVFPPVGADRELEFKGLQATARANKAGVWGQCTPVTCEH